MAHNDDDVAAIIAKRVERTDGRISAKRLRPTVRARARGSARHLRRRWPRPRRSGGSTTTGAVDPGCGRRATCWCSTGGEIGPLFVFCAVLAWSRLRFVSFADNLGAETTMAALAEGMETIGGVPKTLLTDPHGLLEGSEASPGSSSRRRTTCALSPTTAPGRTSVRGRTLKSKGLVEHLVGYVKSDLDDARRAERWRPGDGERQGPGVVRRGERPGALRGSADRA